MRSSNSPTAYMSDVAHPLFSDRSSPVRVEEAVGGSRFSRRGPPRILRVFDSAASTNRSQLPRFAVWPSRPFHRVGTPVEVIAELNGWPASSPVNASPVPLRAPTHDSGPRWVATPFL